MRTFQTVPWKESRCISVALISPILSLVSAFPSTLSLLPLREMTIKCHHLESSLMPLGLHLSSVHQLSLEKAILWSSVCPHPLPGLSLYNCPLFPRAALEAIVSTGLEMVASLSPLLLRTHQYGMSMWDVEPVHDVSTHWFNSDRIPETKRI